MTQSFIANTIGITQQAYSNIENGNRTPSMATAIKIAELLGFDWRLFFPKLSIPKSYSEIAERKCNDDTDYTKSEH